MGSAGTALHDARKRRKASDRQPNGSAVRRSLQLQTFCYILRDYYGPELGII